jgi:DNA-directed RNA polymerase subunit omega
MFDELREEEIVRKVGGRFKLATLMQKRVLNLMNGARPLVDLRTDNKMAIAIAEIMQNKIFLDTSGFVQTVEDQIRDSGELDDDDSE